MEEKGIVLLELSCRTAAELPPPDFSAAPEDTLRSSWKASAAFQPPEYAAGAAGLPPKLRRQSGSSSAAAQLPEYNPFVPHVAVHGLQRVKAQPWLRYPPLRVFTCCECARDVRRSLYD